MLGGTQTRKKARRVSYLLREEEGRHRSGVNSLALNRRGELLFSAGRDATARCWSTGNPRAKCERTFDQHTDWVNDCVLLGDEATLVTCSSDTTIKLWNVTHQKCLATLTEHTDYVKALAYASQREMLASAGLDREVMIWDVEAARAVASMPSPGPPGDITFMKASGHRDSIYCLAINSGGSVVVSGSTERVSSHAIGLLRLWDPRTAQKVGRLKGHSDNVRCVVVSEDGTKCISGSSDATVKVWDIGQQRCIHSLTMHSDSVWSLAADARFETVFSAGRDQLVYATDLKTFESSCMLRSRDAVLKMLLSPDKGLWLSMTNSDIEYWDVEPVLQRERATRSSRKGFQNGMQAPRKSLSTLSPTQYEPDCQAVPLLTAPRATIQGLPAIIKHDFLENRREVLVQDTRGVVSCLDVTSGRQTRSFGQVNFEEQRKALAEPLAVTPWCSVDCKLGCVAVNLELAQVFGCEVYASDGGFATGPDFEEQKLNVGLRVCRSLFREWRRRRKDAGGGRRDGRDAARHSGADEDDDIIELEENLDYPLPDSCRVIISEGGGGPAVVSKTIQEWDGSETSLLPEWMVRSIDRGYGVNDRGEPVAETPKIGFHLLRHPASDMQQMQQGKLNAPQILRARKVLSYAVSKLNLEIPPHMQRPGLDKAVDYLELLCQDELVPPEMNLMSIRKFLAKTSDDLTLHYRWRENWGTQAGSRRSGGVRGLPLSGAQGYA